MEWSAEPREPRRSGIATQSGNGLAGLVHPNNRHCSTRSCARCAGLLVTEWCYDLRNTGGYTIEVLRCVQCGYRVDPMIAGNQRRSRVTNDHARPEQPERFVSTALPDQAA